MNKKKIIYSILLVFLIGTILFFYNSFNGNPLSKYLGKNLVKNYLEETYPDEEFGVESGEYNFKFGEYNYPIIKIGEDPYALIKDIMTEEEIEKKIQSIDYSVSVSGFLKQRIKYDSIRYARMDNNLCEKLSEEASVEITKLIKGQVSNVVAVEVTIEVLKNQLPSDTSWSPDLELDTPIRLHIVTNVSGQDAKAVMDDGIKVQKLLNENDYDYSSVTINANAFDKDLGDKSDYGYLKYYLSFNSDKEITVKDVKEFNKK